MKQINEENLDIALVIGSVVCRELGICCEKRGRIIFQIYEKLEELKSANPVTTEVADISDSSQVKRNHQIFQTLRINLRIFSSILDLDVFWTK